MAVEVVKAEHLNKTFTIRKQKSLKDRFVSAKGGRLHDESFTALNDIDLTINVGESVGLVGPNGSGKSTLLKVIGGILAPDSGRVMTRGRIAALLELGAGFHPDLTGRENIFLNASVLGLTRLEAEGYFDQIVEFSGIRDFIDTQVKFYSSGMYVRLAFAVAVHVDPDVLLVDEVLAVGDEPFQAKCIDKIRQFQAEGRTIIFVSHSAGQVADICDRAVVLEHGKIVEDSTPIVALGRLRRDYQQSIDASKATDTTTVSPWEARIERIYLSSPTSYHHSDFQVVMTPGSDLCFHLEVSFTEKVPDWALKVSVENFLGTTFVEADTRETLGWTMPATEGLVKFVITLPKLMLGEGDYSIRLTVRDDQDRVLDQMNHAGTFAVRGPQHVLGPVYTEPEISFQDPA
ncbi:MAG: ATP-binding cassette domain-containing protein [Propionibacteriaceae bacterium]|jgi:ABC-2 type transport system ATP-binding protein|nr:ATP-binding cassette domain-containing protein [Propionibacteriaceae bacterium]